MPIIKSAKKRVKTAAKANVRNTRTRRDMREAIKAFNKAFEDGKPAKISKLQREAVSAIDIAAKKNVIHRNKAARFKSRLAKQAKAVVRQGSPSSTIAKSSKASPKPKVESRKTKKTVTKKAVAKPKKQKALSS